MEGATVNYRVPKGGGGYVHEGILLVATMHQHAQAQRWPRHDQAQIAHAPHQLA